MSTTNKGLLSQHSRKGDLFARSLRSKENKGVSYSRNKSNEIFHAVKSLAVVYFSGHMITTIKNLALTLFFAGGQWFRFFPCG